MRKYLIAAAAAVGMSISAASAADLPMRDPAPAPVMAAPIFTWTGFYVGAVAGYSWSRATHCDASPPPGFAPCGPGALGPHPRNNLDGWTIGGTVGYNYQMGAVVLGLEGDLSWANWKGSSASVPAFICGTTCRSQVDWFGTVRGRIGYAMGNALPYLTAGVAFNQLKAAINTPPGPNASRSTTQTSFVAGAGVEYAFTHNWSAKIEYLHVFSKGNFVYDTVGACGVPGCFLRTKDVDMVRVGLNYRFGGPSGGVVAKY